MFEAASTSVYGAVSKSGLRARAASGLLLVLQDARAPLAEGAFAFAFAFAFAYGSSFVVGACCVVVRAMAVQVSVFAQAVDRDISAIL